jgi:hypothetical protein
MTCLGQNPSDLLLIDLDLPDGTGIDTIKNISRKNPCAISMAISVFGGENHAINH